MMPERPSPADPEVDSCILCGSVANDALVVRGFKIAQCSSCGHQFLSSPISQNHVAQTYSDAYFLGGGAGYTNYLEQQACLQDSQSQRDSAGRNLGSKELDCIGHEGGMARVFSTKCTSLVSSKIAYQHC